MISVPHMWESARRQCIFPSNGPIISRSTNCSTTFTRSRESNVMTDTDRLAEALKTLARVLNYVDVQLANDQPIDPDAEPLTTAWAVLSQTPDWRRSLTSEE